MLKTVRTIAALAAAATLVALPATAVAAKGGQGKAKNCAKTGTRGFQVTGTLVSMTADGVTITVTSANRHARNSGELEVGGTYTIPADDTFVLRLGDDGAATPSPGDRVKVKGRIALTKKRCAADGTSVADRYAAPDVVRVTISDPATTETTETTETP